mmetsp:Transcript_82960/g.173705  ORF Transcript_82960/g.173705 Transcript_82960/m.173705 type:complete len:230 (+) Transcript_82960:111-800(+)
MTNVPLGPGGWYYDKGHRICISGLGSKATKPKLQGLFGEFGHIIKIETPSRGQAAYVSFKERGDAEDAVKSLDGELVEGHRLSVSKAGERPPPREGSRKEAGPPGKGEVLTTTNSEREERRSKRPSDTRTDREKHRDNKERSDRGDRVDRGRSKSRSRSRNRSQSRSRGKRKQVKESKQNVKDKEKQAKRKKSRRRSSSSSPSPSRDRNSSSSESRSLSRDRDRRHRRR